MNLIRKRWLRILLSTALVILLSAAGLVFWAGSEIAGPSRRPLMDYHREFLAYPAAHGLVIDRFTASDGTPSLVCTPDPSGSLGERGTMIRGQLAADGFTLAPAGQVVGTLVLVHGRKGRKEDYLPIAERLCASGFRCVIPDMPAHGGHPATIATYGIREAGVPARVLDEAARKFAFDPQPAGLLGMSMGGSVAMHATALPDAPWKALVVISSFDSFPRVIESQASRYLGTTLGPLWAESSDAVYQWKSGISIADIQPHRHAASLRLPTLIAHGSSDRVISITSGRRLFDALPTTTPKKWIEVPGADHDNVLITTYPIYAAIAGWMLHNVPAR
jgi:pimeloyl-ACP methyl ester carboxylesterase